MKNFIQMHENVTALPAYPRKTTWNGFTLLLPQALIFSLSSTENNHSKLSEVSLSWQEIDRSVYKVYSSCSVYLFNYYSQKESRSIYSFSRL